MKRLFVLGLCVGLLSGCSTSPVPLEYALPVQLYQPELAKPSESRTELVTITRDSGLPASALTLVLYIDGALVVKLDPYETSSFYLGEGVH